MSKWGPWTQTQRSAVRFVLGASRSPQYCAPLICVLNFSGGLAVWRFHKQTNKKTKQKRKKFCRLSLTGGIPNVEREDHRTSEGITETI